MLGPLLFNMFLIDLFLFVEKSDVYNYADDNSLPVADICIHKIITKLESDIKILETWFKNNGMLLNEDKCQLMIIEPSNISRNNKAKIKIENKFIEEVNKEKLLGIISDNKRTMSENTKHIGK